MRELYRILEKRNRARGALSFERPEPVILLDEAGEPTDILRRERGEAERMIEQFMLTANEGVAMLMHGKHYPCVYRVHDKPEAARLSDFVLYAHNLGLDTRPLQKEKEALSGLDFAAVLREASEKGIENAVSYTMLRAMAKAEYSDKATGHFGLGIPLYSHFTSPIRRLSDLATHRMVKAVLLDGEAPAGYTGYARRASEAASECELRALEAEREIEALYKTLYMARHLGECFDAQISSVTSFGLFAELENTCEGLLPIADLPGSFVYDEKNLSLRSHDAVYRIGERIHVCVEEADIPTRRVRFSLVTEEENA
jgi:ribonuclease R